MLKQSVIRGTSLKHFALMGGETLTEFIEIALYQYQDIKHIR